MRFRDLFFRAPRRVYLDYAASTPVRPEVLAAMRPYWSDVQGNPVSLHKEGVEAARAVETARAAVATALHAHPDEILFTSGGTEGNSIALLGLHLALTKATSPKDVHYITSAIEHPSVLEWFRYFEAQGVSVTYLPINADGRVDPKILKESLRPNTRLLSLMQVNNELGVIQPIAECGRIILAHRKSTGQPLYFHVDASQAALFCNIEVEKFHADLLVVDGQKVYGPKGIGALFLRRGTPLEPIIRGGRQEGGIRGGTQNVSGAVGMGVALTLANTERDVESARLTTLRDYFVGQLREKVPQAEVNGSLVERLPNNVNISIPGFDATFLALQLDARGIAVATRSACIRDQGGSYVVSALGKDTARSAASLRFSFGLGTTQSGLDRAIAALVAITRKG